MNKSFKNKNQNDVRVSNKVKGKVKNEKEDLNLILPRLRNLLNTHLFEFKEEEKKIEKSKMMFKLNQEKIHLETLTEQADFISFDPIPHQGKKKKKKKKFFKKKKKSFFLVSGRLTVTSERVIFQADVSDKYVINLFLFLFLFCFLFLFLFLFFYFLFFNLLF